MGAMYIPPESGTLEPAHFNCSQAHVFLDVPADYTIQVMKDGVPVTGYTTEYEDGVLRVYLEDLKVNEGDTSTTTVTVTTSAGTAESVCRIAPPILGAVTMTAEKMEGGGYTFHITAAASPADADEMYCWAELSIDYGEEINVPMTRSADGSYVGSYYAADLTGSGMADVYVYGSWMGYDQVGTIPEHLYYGP